MLQRKMILGQLEAPCLARRAQGRTLTGLARLLACSTDDDYIPFEIAIGRVAAIIGQINARLAVCAGFVKTDRNGLFFVLRDGWEAVEWCRLRELR